MRDVKQYDVFKLADQLVIRVYRTTESFPRHELFGLTSQMRRAALSIPMNLIEGAARTTSREFANFVNIAVGSCEEVRYQLHVCKELGYVTAPQYLSLDDDYRKVKQMLSKLLIRVSEGRGARDSGARQAASG